ncbi:MAG: hypothetical protein QXZ02_00650 [Candidatus Bathyarchaeia archaeon]
MQQQQRVTKIDMRPLKELVLEKFPPDNQLRIVLLAERDVLEAHEFLAKLETWFILLRGRS